MENELYSIAEKEDVDIKEYALKDFKGLYKDKKILIEKGMTTVERKCILAEELGHYFFTVGDIIDQRDIRNKKQERTARRWAYRKLIPPDLVNKAIKEGHTKTYEMAEYLEVTEEFLKDAIEEYFCKEKLERYKYGG